LTLKKLSGAAALSVHKGQVIVALLDAIGLVRRGRRLGLARAFADEDKFSVTWAEYEGHHQSARDRFGAMINVAIASP
jgi:hypothetical protein